MCNNCYIQPGENTDAGLRFGASINRPSGVSPDVIMNTMVAKVEEVSGMLRDREWASASSYRLDDLADALTVLGDIVKAAMAAAGKLSDLADG